MQSTLQLVYSMKLRNLKASLILEDKVCEQWKGKNYVFKCDGFTFTIYHHSPYLANVTGVKSFEKCDFRSINKVLISKHKRRTHSDYMLLCDRCGYTTNQSSNFNRHFRRKHPEYVL